MIHFGEIDFWTVHGWGFILAMCFFPRLTLIFGTVHGGLLWWLGLIFVPRLQVAIIAALRYGETNLMLVILTWLWALSSKSGEKKTVQRATRKRTPTVTVDNSPGNRLLRYRGLYVTGSAPRPIAHT